MAKRAPTDDASTLRAATRVLSGVAGTIGMPGSRPRPAKAGAPPVDRRRLATMRADVEAQQRILVERRDQISAEIDAASRRVAAMAAYAKCDTLGRPPASRRQTDGATR